MLVSKERKVEKNICFFVFLSIAKNNTTLVVTSVLCNVKIVGENIEIDALIFLSF